MSDNIEDNAFWEHSERPAKIPKWEPMEMPFQLGDEFTLVDHTYPSRSGRYRIVASGPHGQTALKRIG